MRYQFDKEARDVDNEIFTYIYDYMASLAYRQRTYGDHRQDDFTTMDKSKIKIMVNPPKYEEVSADTLYGLMNQNPIFVKFEGVDEIVTFAKRDNEILTGHELAETYSREDSEAFVDPDYIEVQNPGVIDKPGFIANFLKNVFGYKTQAMKDYEEKLAMKALYDHQQAREESHRLAGAMDEDDLAANIQDRANARKAKEASKEPDEKSSILAEAVVDVENQKVKEQEDAKINKEFEENFKIPYSESIEVERRKQLLEDKKTIVRVITDGLMDDDFKKKNPNVTREEVEKLVDTGSVLKEILKSANLYQDYAMMANEHPEQLLATYKGKMDEMEGKKRRAEQRHPEKKAKLDEINARRNRTNSVSINRNNAPKLGK